MKVRIQHYIFDAENILEVENVEEIPIQKVSIPSPKYFKFTAWFIGGYSVEQKEQSFEFNTRKEAEQVRGRLLEYVDLKVKKLDLK